MASVIAYPKAPIYNNLYMILPKRIEIKIGNGKTHMLKLIKNLYVQNQGGQVWNKYLL